MFTDGPWIKQATASDLFNEFSSHPMFQTLPLRVETAEGVLNLGRSLVDPADRVITATARVRGLRLLTSDQRIMSRA